MMDRYTLKKRRAPGRGSSGAAVGLALAVLAVAAGGIGWFRHPRETAETPVPSIIPNSAAQTSPAATAGPETAERLLELEGMTLWGVQLGAYESREAAEAAAAGRGVLFAGERFRVLDSLWPERAEAEARRTALAEESYVTELRLEGVRLRLTGDAAALEAAERGGQTWRSCLLQLLQGQRLLEGGALAADTARYYRAALAAALETAAREMPDGTEILADMKAAISQTKDILAENDEESDGKTVDLAAVIRYNGVVSCGIYRDYLTGLVQTAP